MKTNSLEWSDKAIEYALGLMPEKERKCFIERMKADKRLRNEVVAIQDLHRDALCAINSDFEAPDFSREILARIRADKPGFRKVFVRPYWMGIAASVVLGIAGIVGFRTWIENVVVNAVSMEVEKDRLRGPSDIGGYVSDSDLNTRFVLSPLSSPGKSSQPVDTLSISEQKLLQLTVVSESIWDLVGLDDRDQGPVQRGYILMDMDNKRGYVAIDNLNNPENQILHIWIKLENRKAPIFAGLLPKLNANKGMLYFDFSEVLQKYKNRSIEDIFVTGEVEVNKIKPHGNVLLRNS